jgi:H+-translocating NAD(P) transhydrogenase subunit alpha
MKVAVIKEAAPGEQRVALVPEAVAKLRAAGLEILVESGAGDGAWFADGAYAEAGASIVPGGEAPARPMPSSWWDGRMSG